MLAKDKKQFSIFYSLIVGYFYVKSILFGAYDHINAINFIIFSCLFISWVLVVNKERVKESWIWLGTLLANLIFYLVVIYNPLQLPIGRVWSESIFSVILLHCYPIYWVMSISDGLIETKSSKYFLLDCINGAIIIPFGNIFRFIVDLFTVFKKEETEKKSWDGKLFFNIILALAIAFGLFRLTLGLLASINSSFGSFAETFIQSINFTNNAWLMEQFITILVSLPVTFYLYGLIVGVHEEKENRKVNNTKDINIFLEMIKKLPGLLWNIVLVVFVGLYGIFFIFQFSELAHVFTATLPSVISSYARNGFFELCQVMAINFTLIWISMKSTNDEKLSKGLLTGLLIESILLGLIAFSKIYFYISYFGFTPLRVQSIWFTSVLILGCGCVLYYLYTKKDCSRTWIFITGISLAITILL